MSDENWNEAINLLEATNAFAGAIDNRIIELVANLIHKNKKAIQATAHLIQVLRMRDE